MSKISHRSLETTERKIFLSVFIIMIYIIFNCLVVLQVKIMAWICLNQPEVFLILKNRSYSWLFAAKRNNCVSLIPVTCFGASQKCFNQGSAENGPQRCLTEITRTFDQQARCAAQETRRGVGSFVPCQRIRVGRRG